MNNKSAFFFRQLRKIAITALAKDGNFNIRLCGKSYRVKFEARKIKEDRDFLLLKHLAGHRKCILDVGSNVGISSLLLSENNNAKIFAFEASEESAYITIQHGLLNGISDRLSVVNALLSDSSGDVIPFYWEHTSAGASINPGYLGHTFAIQKATLSIDDFVNRAEVVPDLIKMDIEGAEFIALKGGIETLRKYRPMVLVELHSFGPITLQQNAQQILDLIRPIGYKMIYIKDVQEVSEGAQLNRGRCHVLLCDQATDYKRVFLNFDTTHL